MQESTGDTYQSSQYAKALTITYAKEGKTCFLVGSLLGLMPWQKYGGVVDQPKNLHVVSFDANALGGVVEFLKKTCGAPAEAMKFRVYNLQDDFRRISDGDTDYDMSFYNVVVNTLQTIRERVEREKGVHAVLISSLTGLAAGIERGIVGPPGVKNPRGYADPNKWKLLSHQMTELRNFAQLDMWHCLWEAHLDKTPDGAGGTKESIRVSGEAGRSFAYNVEQVFKIRRQFGRRHGNTNCDLVHLDTRPSSDFIASGRGFTEKLNPEEPDMTLAFHKLGLKVGRWGAKPQAKKVG